MQLELQKPLHLKWELHGLEGREALEAFGKVSSFVFEQTLVGGFNPFEKY